MKKNRKKDALVPPRVRDAIKSYNSPTDPFGSYTGVPNDMRVMPRLTVDGKVYMKVEDGKPVQDVDDL